MTDANRPHDQATQQASELDEASADQLEQLLVLGTDTIENETPPAFVIARPRLSAVGIVFTLVILAMIGGVGWWSFRMLYRGPAADRDLASSDPADTSVRQAEASPWETVAVQTIPTNGQTIVLEAALNAAGDKLLVLFSDSSTCVYPFTDHALGQAEVIEDAGPYPLAVSFTAAGDPALVTQNGGAIQTFTAQGKETVPIQPAAAEVYSWTGQMMATAPLPFDGSVMIHLRDREPMRLEQQRIAGLGPDANDLVVVDRLDTRRVGWIRPGRDATARFVTALDKVDRATVSPDADKIAAILVDGSLVCIHAESGAVLWRRDAVPGIERPVILFTPAGDLLIAEHRLLLLDASDGGVRADLTPDSKLPLSAFDMHFSPDGQILCVLGNDLHILTVAADSK